MRGSKRNFLWIPDAVCTTKRILGTSSRGMAILGSVMANHMLAPGIDTDGSFVA